MEVNKSYTIEELRKSGLTEYPVKDVTAKIFLNGTKVYFFELVDNQPVYRLYSVINRRSFFL